MIGLSQKDTRRLLDEGLDVIMRLLTSEEPVSFQNERWDAPRRAAAPAALLEPTLRRGHGRGRLAHGAEARGAPRHGDALDRGHHGRGLRRAGASLGRDRGRGPRITARAWTAPSGGWWACATSPTPRSRRCATWSTASSSGSTTFRRSRPFPQMSMPGDNPREMIEFINESGFGRHRHARALPRPDRAAVEPVAGRLRRLPDAGAQTGRRSRPPSTPTS